MRVISGTAKGRVLKAVPGQGTRPTSDKVKESIYSMIGPYFEGGTVLDLFAGTGGLGIEALSRGMERAVFIDMEKKSIEIIHHNLEVTQMTDRAEVYRNEAGRALKILGKRGYVFRLVLLDPPYRMKKANALIQTLSHENMLAQDAVAVIEHDASHRYSEEIGEMLQIRRAEYGDTAVSIYSRR